MPKKINPRRVPVSEADVRKAWNEGADFGMTFCIKAFLFVLKDKHSASDEDIMQLRDEFTEIIDAYARGDITQDDLDSVLSEEFNMHVRVK